MIYRDFSLIHGGGIVDLHSLNEYTGTPTLFIGLGGTGTDCLKEMKKAVFNRIKPNSLNSENKTEYDNIQFLAIDSDSMAIEGNGLQFDIDGMTEFLDLSSLKDSSLLYLEAPSISNFMNERFSWLSSDITLPHMHIGSGGIRQGGRLLFFLNLERIINVLHSKINFSMRNTSSKQMNVHIFCGMSGGTGSGVFLDFCYVLQHVLEQYNLLNSSIIIGHLFLPEVSLLKYNNADAIITKTIFANSYAFMSELDYCMDFNENGGKWSQLYSEELKIESTRRPVSGACLVDARNKYGEVINYQHVLSAVIEEIFCCMAFKTDSSSWFEEEKIKHLSLTATKKNKKLKYLTIGASNVRVPMKEINTYCASKVLLGIRRDERNVKEQDLESFIQNNGLTYDNLMRELNREVTSIPIWNRDSFAEIEETLAQNRKSLVNNVVTELKERLVQIAINPDKGLFYGSNILTNKNVRGNDLLSVIEGYIYQNDNAIKQARSDLQLIEYSLEQAKNKLDNSSRFQRRRRMQEYVNFSHKYYLQRAKISLHKEMRMLLCDIKDRLHQFHQETLAPLCEILNNLIETANSNVSYLALETNIIDNSLFSNEKICWIGNEYIEKIDMGGVRVRLYKMLFDNLDDIENEERITKIVANCFIDVFCDLNKRGMDYWLAVKYPVESKMMLVSVVKNHLLQMMDRKSYSLLFVDISKQNDSLFEDCYTNGSSSIVLEAMECFRAIKSNAFINEFSERCSFSLVQYDLCESITISHQNRKSYEDAYNIVDISKGFHLYEPNTLKSE